VTEAEIRAAILGALGDVAPEADLSALAGDVAFRDQLDLDSMDLLNVVVALHQRLKIDIPEADYGRLATLDGAVRYLTARLGAR
jgi:acyl carrier protein